jgi:hypothetical protein
MNREDIIRMAQEAQMPFYWRTGEITYLDKLERFAALVASAEREECKKLCTWKTGNQFVDEAVAVCYRAIDQRGQA